MMQRSTLTILHSVELEHTDGRAMSTLARIKRALGKYGIVDNELNGRISSAISGVELESVYVDIEVTFPIHDYTYIAFKLSSFYKKVYW